jgi:Predicted O-methyltransferase
MQSMIDRQHYFDLIFIDADKNNYPNYYELSLNLIPSNGIIIIDNMLWHGDVANENKNDSQTNTIRDLNLKIQNDNRVDFSLLPFSDGLSFIRKK